jgi:hypothetical protein
MLGIDPLLSVHVAHTLITTPHKLSDSLEGHTERNNSESSTVFYVVTPCKLIDFYQIHLLHFDLLNVHFCFMHIEFRWESQKGRDH